MLIEIVVRDPTASWDRIRQVLGLAALALPSTPFGGFTEVMGSPGTLEDKVEPSRPLVALLCDGGDLPRHALAWKVEDPDRFALLAPDRFALLPFASGVRFLRARAGGSQPARFPIGLAENFLMSGSDEVVVVDHASYLVRALSLTITSADVRIEITRHGAKSATAVHALEQLEGFVAALDERDGDAPSDLPKLSRALGDLGRAWRGWSNADRSARFELSLANDTLTIAAAPLDANSTITRADISGSSIRWWVRSHFTKRP